MTSQLETDSKHSQENSLESNCVSSGNVQHWKRFSSSCRQVSGWTVRVTVLARGHSTVPFKTRKLSVPWPYCVKVRFPAKENEFEQSPSGDRATILSVYVWENRKKRTEDRDSMWIRVTTWICLSGSQIRLEYESIRITSIWRGFWTCHSVGIGVLTEDWEMSIARGFNSWTHESAK